MRGENPKELIMKLKGNLSGLSQATIQKLNALYEIHVERGQVINALLAGEMAAITHAIHKEIAVYLNRRGKVVHGQLAMIIRFPWRKFP